VDDHGYDFRRKHERKKYLADVVFAYKGRAYGGTIKDISLGGAFITTASVNQFSSGDIITISIPFTDGSKSVKRRARVGWRNEIGFAVEFI
jgi:hypothetical protein